MQGSGITQREDPERHENWLGGGQIELLRAGGVSIATKDSVVSFEYCFAVRRTVAILVEIWECVNESTARIRKTNIPARTPQNKNATKTATPRHIIVVTGNKTQALEFSQPFYAYVILPCRAQTANNLEILFSRKPGIVLYPTRVNQSLRYPFSRYPYPSASREREWQKARAGDDSCIYTMKNIHLPIVEISLFW